MARYLFAWELGGDYGHLARLLPLAQALRGRGHDVVFAVRDLMGAEKLIAPQGIRTYQAPLWLRKASRLPDAISYPELLMRFGYLHAMGLTGICRAWRNLIELLQPDAIVMDHAPTALLATRGLTLARVNFGDGFCIPPRSQPIPPMRWWQEDNAERLRDSEQHALVTSNQVLQALQAPVMNSMCELRDCDETLLCTFPELDHYPQRDERDYLGPIFTMGQGAAPQWPACGGPRVFAYLKPGHAQMDAILAALRGVQASVLVHIPGAARQTLQRFGGGNMHISLDMLAIDRVASECDLAVCHGGAGTTAAMLLAGKPLMVIPMQLEQAMTAHRLEGLGAAVAVTPQRSHQFARLLARALTDKALALAAATFALNHRDYDAQATIARAADRCEAVLRGQAP